MTGDESVCVFDFVVLLVAAGHEPAPELVDVLVSDLAADLIDLEWD